ncbi:MAG TPA: translation initiation factor IF-2, partial [Candidatus Latescibacteria bacterium]|nr:translation initiation factor IF-2 [Candidatus Latescibacterota bacterium]
AFTAMRARGARVTDLVIVVVAADDGVMPQTIEAIDHAKAAQVRIIVAINKIDLPTSDPERIKRELSERGVLLEDWGGNVSCAEMSAKTGAGVDKLLELVMLEAELLELKADPVRLARGTIVESQLDKGRGPVATVLVQSGTLRVGDPFVTGVHGGRVRALFSENMTRLKEAGPSVPVQVLGLSGVPQAGDSFAVIASEREAREITQRRQQLKREQDFRHSRVVTLGDLQYQIQQGKIKELNVVVKGDVDGSVEAINQELGGITHEEVRIAIIHSSVGPVSESDVLLASASNAVIVAFGVSIDSSVRELAVQSGVDIRQYSIIYEVIEELRSALSGLLSPEVEERVIGSLQVREVFSSSRAGTIAGCFVQTGKITRNHRIRVMRAGESLFQGDVASLRRFKDD